MTTARPVMIPALVKTSERLSITPASLHMRSHPSPTSSLLFVELNLTAFPFKSIWSPKAYLHIRLQTWVAERSCHEETNVDRTPQSDQIRWPLPFSNAAVGSSSRRRYVLHDSTAYKSLITAAKTCLALLQVQPGNSCSYLESKPKWCDSAHMGVPIIRISCVWR